MIKEIGSIFPLSNQNLQEGVSQKALLSHDKIEYSLCREAFYDIAVNLSAKRKLVFIPAYTCQTVITPFEEAGWSCIFYGIRKDLRIDVDDLLTKAKKTPPSLLVVHPYFGMDLANFEASAIQRLKNAGVKIIVDLTQCIFSNQKFDYVDYYVGSYRKWFAIPDGGFLINNSDSFIRRPLEENVEFVLRQTDAMYLRDLYFRYGEQRIKDISIRLSKAADKLVDSHISPHCISRLSRTLLCQYDLLKNQRTRFSNFSFLYEHLKGNTSYQPVCCNLKEVTTAPLYFTIYVDDRIALQKQLASNRIYAPVIWPVEDERVLISKEVLYIYDHILAIPCDQRYDERDMKQIAEIINKETTL